MKNSILMVLLVLLSFSCTNEEGESNNEIETIEFKTLMNSPVALEMDGKIELAVTKNRAIHTFNQFEGSDPEAMNANDVKVEEIHGKNYLRFYSADGRVATLELIKSENNTFITGNTVCESVACAECCGCVPDGLYCTKCTKYPALPGGPVNDCKRTTGGPVIEQ
jgi:hypothetical protein